MKGTITALSLMFIISLCSFAHAQTTTYESVKNNQCSWNDQTQSKDLCRETLSNVQIEINRSNQEILITTDGYLSVYHIDEETILSNPYMEFKLTSADGTAWEMSIDMATNIIWMDLTNSQFSDSISYQLLN